MTSYLITPPGLWSDPPEDDFKGHAEPSGDGDAPWLPDVPIYPERKRTMITKAISIRAPWWWFILHGGKDIENRDWPTNFRGTVYVHASKWWSLSEVSEDTADAIAIHKSGVPTSNSKGITYREMRDAGGCIVGTVDIIGCVRESSSPWFFGDYGFVLANPIAFAQPILCKGALGFFTVPDDVLAKIAEARNAETT